MRRSSANSPWWPRSDPASSSRTRATRVALHYRLAPEPGAAWSRQAVDRICAEHPAAPIEILPRQIRPGDQAGRIQQGAPRVRELMRYPPFAGRHPIFIGDDVTDESVFAIMPEFDGLAFSVGRDGRGRRRALRQAGGGARLARPHRGRRRKCRAMTDHGLDLAVIGNGRTAALVDPCVAHRVVVLSRISTAIRSSAGCWPATRRRASPTSCSTTWSTFNPSICATPRSYRRCSPTGTAARCGSPILRRAFASSAACSGRRSCFASSSRSPGCRASPSGCGRRTTTVSRFRGIRSAAITSAIWTRTRSSA